MTDQFFGIFAVGWVFRLRTDVLTLGSQVNAAREKMLRGEGGFEADSINIGDRPSLIWLSRVNQQI